MLAAWLCCSQSAVIIGAAPEALAGRTRSLPGRGVLSGYHACVFVSERLVSACGEPLVPITQSA